jgi:hypothetical protein
MRIEELLQKNKQKQLVKGADGLLSEEKPLQQLAGEAGLVAPPTTAIGASMIGASPNVAKMAGGPAQKTKALSLASEPTENLQDATRRQEVRKEKSAEEVQQAEKSETLKQLGGLGDRVHSLIEAERQKLVAPPTAAPTVESVDEFAGKDISSIKSLLSQLRVNPSDMNLQLQLNQALGKQVGTTLTPEQINSLYESATESIARGAAGSVDDDLTASDLIDRGQLGYTREQLSELLAVPLEQIDGLSIAQIRDHVSKLADEEFSKTQELQQQATSNLSGIAERGLAQQAGLEASATGMRSTEADVQKLEQSIANADIVQFGGQSYKVDDLLKDETISGIVKEYLESPEGSEVRQRIDSSEPQLKAFIDANRALLEDAASALGAGAEEFTDVQSDNQGIATAGGLLSPSIAAKLIPEYKDLAAGRLDPSQVPILNYANSLSEVEKQQFAQNLNVLAEEFPDVLEEIGTLTPEEIQQLGINRPDGKWTSFTSDVRRYDEMVAIQDENIMDLVGKLYNVGNNFDYQAELDRNQTRGVLGFGGTSGVLDMVDLNRDGKIDSADEIRGRILQGRPTLKGALGGSQVPGRQKYVAPDPLPDYEPDQLKRMDALLTLDEGQIQANLAKFMGPSVLDGKVDVEDLQNLVRKGTDQAELNSRLVLMDYLNKKAQLDDGTRDALTHLITTSKNKTTGQRIAKVANVDKDWKDTYQQVGFGVKYPETEAMASSLEDGIAMLQKYMAEPAAKQAYHVDDFRNRLQLLKLKLEVTRRNQAEHNVRLGQVPDNKEIRKYMGEYKLAQDNAKRANDAKVALDAMNAKIKGRTPTAAEDKQRVVWAKMIADEKARVIEAEKERKRVLKRIENWEPFKTRT